MRKKMRCMSVLLAAAFLLTLLLPGFAVAQNEAPDFPPPAYYGKVTINGQPAPAGTVIEAKIDGEVRGSIVVKTPGKYGGPEALDPKLKVDGTSSDKDKIVTFWVKGIKANETDKFDPETPIKELDLTVNQQETVPPTVSSTDPADGATGVAVGKVIAVNFSENIQKGKAFSGITLKSASGSEVAVGVSISGTVLSIKPTANLAYNTRYTVTIPAGAVQDLAGNALAQQYTFSFTTLAAPDTTPPVVSSTDPANGAPGVAVSKTISVTFDEDVQAGTAYDGISVKDASGNTVAVTKNITGKVLSLKPNATLAYNTKYTVTIPAGAVKDLAGNTLAADCTFSFTTQAASGGGGGGGGGATAPSTDKVEKPVQAGATTVAEISGKAKIELPAGAVTGTNAAIKAEVVGDEKASGAGMTLLSKVVDVTLKNATLTGKASITLYFDKGKLGKDQEPAAFYYDEKQSKWVRLEGTVEADKGTVTVTVDRLTMFAVFAVAKQVQPPPPPVVSFKDMQGHWAADAVSRLAGMGIVSGYPDGTFGPDRQVTRAEVTAIMAKLLWLEPGKESELNFKDNAAIPAWAKGAVAAAVKEGIIKGYPQPDGSTAFEAARQVSRAEMAAMAARVLEKKLGSITPAELKFTDVAAIPGWAKSSVGTAVAKGIISGYPDGTFKAAKNITRAETAAMVLRLLDALGE